MSNGFTNGFSKSREWLFMATREGKKINKINSNSTTLETNISSPQGTVPILTFPIPPLLFLRLPSNFVPAAHPVVSRKVLAFRAKSRGNFRAYMTNTEAHPRFEIAFSWARDDFFLNVMFLSYLKNNLIRILLGASSAGGESVT